MNKHEHRIAGIVSMTAEDVLNGYVEGVTAANAIEYLKDVRAELNKCPAMEVSQMYAAFRDAQPRAYHYR